MKKRLFAALMALSLSLSLTLLPTAGASYTPNTNVWNKRPENLTPEQQKRILLEWLLMSAGLAPPFEDVPPDSWAYAGVGFVWRAGLMSGVSETSFAPDVPTNRAMTWTVLARMRGASTTAEEGQEWYVPGMIWAAQQGLGDGSDPMGEVTREYLVDMLWKCAGSPLTPANLNGFSDYQQVSGYALSGMQWAVSTGILQGEDGRLSPQGGLTRAELAAMVMRFSFL